jgi:hypothetical protein
MTSAGGGWTLVRRSAGTVHFPGNDNLAGTFVIGVTPSSLTGPATASIYYSGVPYTDFRFATGDETLWLIAARSQVEHTTTTYTPFEATITLSSRTTGSTMALWFNRAIGSSYPEDPWISIEDHNYMGIAYYNDSEVHSMLYGEGSFPGWLYYLTHHAGLNVFIR